jgi:hypothetical protein
MPKSAPLSLRLSPEIELLVEQEAERTRRSKGAVIEALAAEALQMRLFPGIAFRGTDWDRRAWVIGTSLDVWEIVLATRDFDSIEDMAQESDLTERQIRIAVAYHERFPVEIDRAIARSQRTIDELGSAYPTIAVVPAPAS